MSWIQHNLNQRLIDKTLDFKFILISSKFKVMAFHDASDYTAQQIAALNIPLYLGLSGGADSEYVLLCFHRNKIPIIPIIVKTSGNELETSFAFHICHKLNITPIVLNLLDEDNIKLYAYCFNKLNGGGMWGMSTILASNYAKKNNGILITGNHLIEENNISVQKIDAHEWDFYSSILTNKNDINFFNYNPEIVYSMIYRINGLPSDEFKHTLYETSFRPKINPTYTDEFYKKIKNIEYNNPTKANCKYIFGKKEEVLSMMEKWNAD